MAGKNTYYVARRVFRKKIPYVAQKKNTPHTIKGYALYSILHFHLTSPLNLTFSTHPNRWFLLLTCLIFLHFLTLHPQIKQSSSLWNSFVHLFTSLLRSPLVHLFHSVTVLFFPFSYASEPTSKVELSSLYVSNFLLAHLFLQFWVSNNFMFHPEGTMISLLRFFVHNCFIHASAGAWQGRLGPMRVA